MGWGIWALGLLLGCEKSEPTAFASKSAIVFDYFETVGNKKIYSFLGNASDQAVLGIPVIVNGFAADVDRSFEVEVISDTITNAAVDSYAIQQSIIRAGRIKDTLYVLVKKTPELEEQVAHLYLRVKDNALFDRGIIERQYYEVAWSNQAIMPTWGVYFRTFFTAVGSTKAYRIFVETTGLTNFAVADFRVYGQAGAEVLGKKFGDYIRAWNLAHPHELLRHDDGTQAGQVIVPRY